MRQSVRDAFYEWNKAYEGGIPWLYQDVKGLVSIGVGILADPPGLAMSLPLRRADGTLATTGEIRIEFDRIKGLGTGPAKRPDGTIGNPAAYGGANYSKRFTTLHLDDAGMHLVVERKADQMVGYLRNVYPNFEEFPADAQLGILSVSWAMGPAFQRQFPKLDAAIRRMDWLTCAVECHLQEKDNPGVKPRNLAMDRLFRNASVVDAQTMCPDTLYWPRELDQEPPEAA